MITEAPARLLIVDDETQLMTVLNEMLTEQGYETAGFTSARAALEELKRRDFDIVLTDLMMPEMDGVTLLKTALEIDPSLVAIVMTGLIPAVASTLDPNTILHKVAEAALQQCDSDTVSIMLPAEDGRALCVEVAEGKDSNNIRGARVAVDEGIAGWVARHHETLAFQGRVDDPRFSPMNPRDSIHSSVSMPMMVGSKLVGVLNVSSTKSRQPISVGETKALAILANLAAPALESARHYRRMQETERRYRSIFENAVEGMFQTTPSGKIIEANPAMAAILGYESPEELIESISDLGAEVYVDSKARKRFLAEIEAQGLIKGFEAQMYRKDGSRIWASVGARAIYDESGDELRFEGGIEDISERKLLEEQLVQSQKMEAIGTLAGGIAHDFNNLLTAIIGYSQLAASRLNEDDRMFKEIEEIRKAGTRAAELTKQLLVFSRKEVLQLRVMDLNTTVENVGKMIRRVIGEDIELVTSLDPELGRIKADPGQIEQVIINLAVNARDAMPQGGKLIIETGNIILDEEYTRLHFRVQPGAYVMMAVRDTDFGMEAETQSHIFDPFFTTKEPGKGTGLGLSTVYGIVKQSDGDIWVYSEPGRGTTFKLYLPCVERRAEESDYQESPAIIPRGTETILLVEDEALVRNLAALVLREQGYEVLESSSGEEALRIARYYHGSIHMLLTDVVMPKMSGKELSEQIKLIKPDISVLFASGYTDDAVVHHGVLEADMQFIQKPFTPNTLANKVREVLNAGVGKLKAVQKV